MAAFITNRTGNWSDDAANVTSPWHDGGGVQSGVPGTSDTVTISAGHTVTVDAATTTGACVIGSGAGTATVVIGTDQTLTLSGNLQVGGNVDGVRGAFTFGAGSTFALGSSNLVLANGILRSNSTTDSWATVTGTGAFGTTASGSPMNDNVLEYVSFQNTGTVAFPVGTSRGTGLTAQINIQHCTFIGCSTIRFGVGSVTALSVPYTIDYNDFRDLTSSVIIAGALGEATSTNSFSHNTWNQAATTQNFDHTSRGNLDVTGTVFSNVGIGSSSTSGNITYDGCFQTRPDGSASGSTLVALVGGNTGSINGSTIKDSYYYCNWTNPHPIGFTGISTGLTHSLTGNVIETGAALGGDCISLGYPGVSILNNVMIGSGDLITALTSAASPGGATANHNTIYHDGGVAPAFWVTETNNYSGTATLNSNIVVGATTLEEGSQGLSAIVPQVASADYNCHYNVTTKYKWMTITGATHDLDDTDPQFIDNTRTLATWDAARGSTTGTPAAAITYLLTINGYDDGDKIQSGTPSTNGPDDLVLWVRKGFVVQNTLLENAGHDGATIGACDYIATLVIQDSVHAHRSSNLVLSPGSGESDLVIPDSVHAHTSDLLTLTTAAKLVSTLTIPDSVHATSSDNLTLTSQGIVDLAVATTGTARYDVGDLVRVIGQWKDPFNADAAIDPTVVKCSIKTPASVTTTYTYGTDADVKKESTGVYYMDVSITQSGNWYYRWWSTGTAQAAEENVLVVAPQAVATPVVP